MKPDDQNGSGSKAPTRTGDAGERLSQDIHAASRTAQRDFDALAAEARSDIGDLKEAVGDQVHAAGQKARSFTGEQKDLAAGQLEDIAAAVSRAADELNNSDQAAIGRYARDVAQGVNRLATNVRNNDVDELLAMAQDFGRSQPLAFLGMAAAAGFMASRFALASSHRRSSNGQQQARATGSSGMQRPDGQHRDMNYGGNDVH